MSDAILTVSPTAPSTLVVDAGRPRTRSLGVPVGGAADRWSLAIGNALVGNPPFAPALEIALAGPTLRANADLGCVLYGAQFTLRSDRQHLATGKTFTLHADEEIQIRASTGGMFGYFCIRGGLLVPEVLGSHSSLEPLKSGTCLACKSAAIRSRFLTTSFRWNAEPNLLRTIDGLQADWFETAEFYTQEFAVSQFSNRMGLRLKGNPITLPARELVSEPVGPGAVQVTRDGQCIVLGVDGQTIGGYPKIAQVIEADLDKLAQLRPGALIRFQKVSLTEAEALHDAKRTELHEWLTRLRTTEAIVS